MKRNKCTQILNYIAHIIESTEWANHVFAVGGCVRDLAMLKDAIKDIDLVVDIQDGGIKFAKALFEANLLVREPIVYERFGTAMFRLKVFPDEEIEVVHTRSEQYPDHNSRNPQQDFGTLEEDCMRRDLTINAMYINVCTKEFIDPSGMGIDDLQDHLLRTPRNPVETYYDDPLRMLRCVRFATRYEWRIELRTLNAIYQIGPRLDIISRERIHDELQKILGGPNFMLGMRLLYESSIHKYIALDYGAAFWDRILNRYTHIQRLGKMCNPKNLPVMCMALMGADEDLLKKLKFDSNEIRVFNAMTKASEYLKRSMRGNFDEFIKRQFSFSIDPSVITFEPLALASIYMNVKDEWKIAQIEDRLKFELETDEPTFLKMNRNTLPVDGNDIMKVCKVGPGVQVKNKMDTLIESIFMLLNPDEVTRDRCLKILEVI